jgi:hypothetical protein
MATTDQVTAASRTAQQIANHLRQVHLGGNWTSVNLKDTLMGITWQQATTQVYGFNTIVTLLYHVNYYIGVAGVVLKGGPLDAKDEYGFNHPPVSSQQDWQALQEKLWSDAEAFAKLIELLPESRLWETFTDEKYGTYYRNLQGIIEHMHYHLGQIVLIKKIVQRKE